MSARVAVTTSRDRAPAVAEELRRVGLEPVLLPCILVEPFPASELASVREAAAAADLLLLTSGRPLELLWPEERLPPVAVAAVGEATAALVERRGGRIVAVGSGGAADLLADLDLAGKAVVYPHSEATDPDAIDLLRRRAARAVEAAVYRTVPAAPGNDPVDAAAFASPTAVAGWTSARGLDGLVTGAIGRTTAAELARRGRPADVVAGRPGYGALAKALAEYLEER